MQKLSEKVAFLQGLTEGLELGDNSKEGKVLRKIIDILEEMAAEIEDLQLYQEEMEQYVEAIDEDLADLEKDFYDDDDEDDDDDDLIEIECPNCGESVYFDEDYLLDEDVTEVTCPNCGEVVYFDDADEDRQCGCEADPDTEDK